MMEICATLPEKEKLELLQQEIHCRAEHEFEQKVLRDELVNRLSLRFVSSGPKQCEPIEWLRHNYPKEVETYFSDLFDYCLHYAVKIVSDPVQAEDIAQDSIRELLACRCEIKTLRAWLARVVHNKAIAYYQTNHRADKLCQDLKQQMLPPDPDEADFEIKIEREQVKKLLSKTDYLLYKKIFDASNLKAYAKQQGINYQTAKEHKHRIKVNLRSAYLKEQGWKDSQEILSYQQLRSIKRFICRLVENRGKGYAKRHPDVQTALSDCTGLMTWEISMLDERSFHLFLMFSTNALPEVLTMDIKLNRAHRISITKSKRGTLIATMPEGTAKPLSTLKGKAVLNYQELLKLVPQAEVYDQELFSEMLETLKDN